MALSSKQKSLIKYTLKFLEIDVVIVALAGLLALQRGLFPDINRLVFLGIGLVYLYIVLTVTIRTRIRIQDYLLTEPQILKDDPYHNN